MDPKKIVFKEEGLITEIDFDSMLIQNNTLEFLLHLARESLIDYMIKHRIRRVEQIKCVSTRRFAESLRAYDGWKKNNEKLR